MPTATRPRTRGVPASEVAVGDVIVYCGASYEVTATEAPDAFGTLLLRTVKRVGRRVVSRDFQLARQADDVLTVFTRPHLEV